MLDEAKKSKKVSDAVNAKANDGDAAGKPDTDAGVTKVAHPGQSEKVEETEVDGDAITEKADAKTEEEETEKKSEKDEKYMKAAYKKEEIDVSEHVDALINGEEALSEGFTMGQYLSIPFMLIGGFLVYKALVTPEPTPELQQES